MEKQIRFCKNFDLSDQAIFDKYVAYGKNDKEEDVAYIPASIRILWFNAYQEEANILMGVTTERVEPFDDDYITYRATLRQFIGCDYKGRLLEGFTSVTPVVIASSEASALKTDPYGPEGAETKAIARCLRLAGFNVQKIDADDSEFAEGSLADAPIIVPDLIKNNEDTDYSNEDQLKFESEPPKEKKKSAPKKAAKKQLSDVFPALKKEDLAEKSDVDKLRFCLNSCFYPWTDKDFDRGDLIKDICMKPKFIEKLEWVLNEYAGDAEIAEGVKIKEWAEILARFFINSSPEDKKILIQVLTEK